MEPADRRDAEAQRLAELTGNIIGVCIEVHRAVGPGLLESAYEALVVAALQAAGLRVRRQLSLPVEFMGLKVDVGYRIDLLVEDCVIVELKAVEKILPVHQAQLLTYLKLSGLTVGLLINFNVSVLKDGITRLVNNYPDSSASLRLCGLPFGHADSESAPDQAVTQAIPHRPPFLFVDRIAEQGEGRIVTERTFRPDEAFFAGHYPGSPLTPGVLLCEACFQTGAILLMAQRAQNDNEGADGGGAAPNRSPAVAARSVPMLTRIQDAKFRNSVLPGETCRLEVTLDEKMGNAYLMTGKVTSGARKVLTVQFIVVLIEPGKA